MLMAVPSRLTGLALLLVVLAAAGGTRAWYLTTCAPDPGEPPPLRAQDPPPPVHVADGSGPLAKKDANELDDLTYNLREHRWFGGLAPLADKEEKTAHVSPGYPWLLALAETYLDDASEVVRWAQCVIGALTAGLYFLFAWRAFQSTPVALLAGLFCALNPFWIVNTAEINDGVLATFLLAVCLAVGTRGSQEGEVLPSLLFGLALAGLVLVRAALLVFAVPALLWFLWRCRTLRRGWLCALLAFLGFANGVAPWTVRNFRTFNEVVPVADSMFLHLWEGNNALATGGPQDERARREALPADLRKQVLDETSQPRRYNLLAQPLLESVTDDPAGTVERRSWAAVYFFIGQAIFTDPVPGRTATASGLLPEWLSENYYLLLVGTLAGMFVLAFLAWRWTYPWRRQAMLATLAILWVPLPYVLGHGERLWGPRLPLDGVLLCLAAFALVRLVPGVGWQLAAGPRRAA
jgi:4-amino-4-deoxy-L-arabinose transferase-like glycosyltransferase